MEVVVTKDKDGQVALWDESDLPLKKNNTLGYWYGQHVVRRCINIKDSDGTFADIQWSDDEPTMVKLVIDK